MSEILFQYEQVYPTTWVYLSSLLMIGLYFKFGRFWSVRNLDLILLILLAPGLLVAMYGSELSFHAQRSPVAEAEPQPVALDAVAVPAESADDGEEEAAIPADALRQGEAPTLSGAVEPLVVPPAEQAAREDAAERPQAAGVTADLLRVRDRGRFIQRLGFLWLFVVGGLFTLRMLLDPTMVRRPLLEPNLTTGGLTFLGISLFIFLMANVWTSPRVAARLLASPVLEEAADPSGERPATVSARRGPGYALLNVIPSIPTTPLIENRAVDPPPQDGRVILAKLLAIIFQLALTLGIVGIGYWHFGNVKTGVGVATLYLMLPYTARMSGQIDHVIPAALLVWAVLCYRRPLTAGMVLGLATSLVYYPLFLLPLWLSFYWRRGLARFVGGFALVLVVMAVLLAFIPTASYWENLKQMCGLWMPAREGLEGVWAKPGWDPVYRIPVLAAFVALCGTLAIWPAQKNLGTLLSCSAAVMVATQFWHGYGGGLYMGWYLPLSLLTIFRPNLEDRVALAVLGEGWILRRAPLVSGGSKAA